MATDKIQLVHPDGKNAPRISMETYNMVRTGIIHALEAHQPMTFADMARAVKEYVTTNAPGFDGSVEWFTVSVKQHMESEGVIETVIEKGRKMHRLK